MTATDVIQDADVVEEATQAAATDLVPVQPTAAIIRAETPDDILGKASRIADSLKGLIEQQGLAIDVGGGKKHVEVNGWQALGTLLGALGGEPLHAETVWTRLVLHPDSTPVRHAYTATVKRYYRRSEGGGVKSETTYDVDGHDWEACVEVRTAAGVVVGRAEAMCSRSESTWGTREEFALRSMAETRAESRAYRRAAGWIVAIAGYNPTPAEEMPPSVRDDRPSIDPADDSQVGQARKVLAYLFGTAEEDPAINDLFDRLRSKFGCVPYASTLALGRVAATLLERRDAVQLEPEADGGVVDTDGGSPMPGSVVEPESTGDPVIDAQNLKSAGCICPYPVDPGTHDSECPIHGIMF